MVAGTASVIFSVAAYNDLVGEFGRLVVHPQYRGQGIGKRLMEMRIDRVHSRIQVGIVENRASHSFSQRISKRFGFVPVGFIPMKLSHKMRESVAVYVRYFGQALALRRNNPRVIPEISPLAALSLTNCQLPIDPIVDDSTSPFPYDDDFQVSQLRTEGYTALLRIERGRIRHREVFGPVRLHYGMFHIQSRHSNYLIARRHGQVAGGIGFMVSEEEKVGRIFELISVNDDPVRLLLKRLIETCEKEFGINYLEVDVSAYAPRLQRTLLELGFLPVSYIPANVFHQVERLDVVRMAKLFVPFRLGEVQTFESVKDFRDLIVNRFESNAVMPRIAEVAQQVPMFKGLSEEQRKRLISNCVAEKFAAGDMIYGKGHQGEKLRLILEGTVGLSTDEQPVAEITTGQCLGETSLLFADSRLHSLTATAKTEVETAAFAHDEILQLIRRNPDIGVIIYRNLAADLRFKLSPSSRYDGTNGNQAGIPS